jgi:hypothetical protein
MTNEQWFLLLFIPIGGILLFMDDQHTEEKTTGFSTGKERYYLIYNKDEIFKGLLATEGHFRNVSDKGTDSTGFMNCAVKHLADAEGHADEAVCHSLVVASAETSEHYKKLAEEIKTLRHDVQEGNVNASQGIERVRQIRREFEGFNPDFDISKCKACELNE